MASKKSIEQEIAYHLKNNDPESAKSVYDQWVMKKNKKNSEQDELVAATDYGDHDVLF